MTIINNRIEVQVSFDTTGSMSPAIGQVRRSSKQLFQRLANEIPGIRMGVTAHGDYCDNVPGSYVTKHLDLNSDVDSIVRFIDQVKPTHGGDAPECYELVLHEAQKLSWTPGYEKVLVMIGDATPHPPHHYENKLRLDWREEARKLHAMGVKIYAVQALGYYANAFWRDLAAIGGGHYISLDQFAYIQDMLLAICYKQAGPDALARFEEELTRNHRLNRNMATVMGTLAGKTVAEVTERTRKAYGDTSALKACPPSRFQILDIEENVMISTFVESQGIPFMRGRGFYQFSKTETIQANKEIILQDKLSGDLFEGDVARDMIGLPKGVTVRVPPAKLDRFNVFVQSNSYNRKLIGGTKFLYEVDTSR